MIDYLQKAKESIENNQIESALTQYISGMDHGCAKCAYELLMTVLEWQTFTLTEEEAHSMFDSNYQSLKQQALDGDAEAMYMIAQSIKLGFVDEDEPYMYWLQQASVHGFGKAKECLSEEKKDDMFYQYEESGNSIVDDSRSFQNRVLQADANDAVLYNLVDKRRNVGSISENSDCMWRFVRGKYRLIAHHIYHVKGTDLVSWKRMKRDII